MPADLFIYETEGGERKLALHCPVAVTEAEMYQLWQTIPSILQRAADPAPLPEGVWPTPPARAARSVRTATPPKPQPTKEELA